jgi:hypothetical protein
MEKIELICRSISTENLKNPEFVIGSIMEYWRRALERRLMKNASNHFA